MGIVDLFRRFMSPSSPTKERPSGDGARPVRFSAFSQIRSLLTQRFPGTFATERTKQVCAAGLKITCAQPGYAFVYKPERGERGFLMAVYVSADDDNPEVWHVADAEEAVAKLSPWAFPHTRTLPPPVDVKKERKRLGKIAQGLAARVDAHCRTSEPDAVLVDLLTPEERSQFPRVVDSIDPRRILRNFPADSGGRLALRTEVVLRVSATTSRPARERDVCLVAAGPERRRDEQSVCVRLATPIVLNQTHRWQDTPWLWQDVDAPDSWLLGAGPDAPSVHRQVAESAARSLDSLDSGQIEEAFALYGVSFSDDLHRLLGGQRISPPACCAHADQAWTDLLVATLRQAAPWLIPVALRNEAERLARWASEKKGRRRSCPQLKLVTFPGQHHIRKASLMLTGDKDGSRPGFEIQATGSNARIHDVAWKRPILVDFIRHGIDIPRSLTNGGAEGGRCRLPKDRRQLETS